ncbi:MAG: hypothetical protein HYU56_04060 [Candidatus Aenigmarchaeota archaeon]|nr:hypothetical protein [Candidatus Aenigmarchaeota archaeon]
MANNKWIRLTLFTQENLQNIIRNNLKPLIFKLTSGEKVEQFYFFQYPQEGKIEITIQGDTEEINKKLLDMVQEIKHDSTKTEIKNPSIPIMMLMKKGNIMKDG